MNAPEPRKVIDTACEQYSPALLDAVATRAAQYVRNGKQLEPDVRWKKALSTPGSVKKLMADLPDDARKALALVDRCPGKKLRWDHAVRTLAACGSDHAEAVFVGLLSEGLLILLANDENGVVNRLEISPLLGPASLPTLAIPEFAGDPIAEFPNPIPVPASERVDGPWRSADGWEIPIRLARLWRLAQKTPIKRTMAKQLFKRDQDRISGDSILSPPPIDSPVPLHDPPMFCYELAKVHRWLDPDIDEQRPTANLDQLWPPARDDLLFDLCLLLPDLDGWNELGEAAPAGMFWQESASARRFLLLMLATIGPGECIRITELARVLAASHSPWNGKSDYFGPWRGEEQRLKLANEWTKAALLGPLYHCRAVEYLENSDGEFVRLTPIGRGLTNAEGFSAEPEPEIPTLLVQPNHQIVVYRQGLTLRLLSHLIRLAELKNAGSALQLEINADSVYLGLESGLSEEDMVEILTGASGRPLPIGVVESIRTWSQKRDRITVYGNIALYEFDTTADMNEAIERGVDGTPISDRLLLVAGEPTFPNLRIGAQRDYLRLPPEPCVTSEEDGVTLDIDGTRSDLLLESEVSRFADPLDAGNGTGFRRKYRITPSSITRAGERGIGAEWLDEWFQRRTGESPPPAVALLLRLSAGAPVFLRDLAVIEIGDEKAADGLFQHPETASLFLGRLGPRAIAVDPSRKEEILAALKRLGARPNSLEGSQP